MTDIHIPKQFLAGFKKLKELPEEDVRRIADAVSKISQGGGPRGFIKALVKDIPIPGILPIAESIVSTVGLIINRDDIEALALDFARSYAATIEDETEFSDSEEINLFAGKLQMVLAAERNLGKTYKAVQLSQHNPNIFRECRIASDIRLIFDYDLSKKNRSAIVQHQLGIEYFSNGEANDFFIALDRNDLEQLKEQINRALEKEQLIRSDYGTDITFIELTD